MCYTDNLSVDELQVFDVELYLGAAAPVVLFELVAEVETVGAHPLQAFAHLEGDGRVGCRALGKGDGVELEVIESHDAGVAGIDELAGDEDGYVVVGSEGGELLEDAEELGRDLREAYLGVDFDFGDGLFGTHAVAHELLEAVDKGSHVLLAEGYAGGALVATEVLEEVGAFLEGLVDVELAHGAGGASDEVVAAAGEDDGGLVVGLDDTAGHDAHDAAMPVLVEEHQRLATLVEGVVVDAALGLFGGRGVEFFALHVVAVDIFCQTACDVGVVGKHEAHGVEGRADAAGGIDAGTDEEHQVGDGELFLEIACLGLLGLVGLLATIGLATVDVAIFEDGFDAGAGLGVEDAEAEEGQHAVLAHDGHDVGGDADGYQVEVLQELELQLFLPLLTVLVELLGEVAEAHAHALLEVGLDNLEADAAAREFLVGIGAVDLLGVEDGYGFWHLVAGQVVVADDEVDAELLGIVDHLHGLDATVEGDDQLDIRLAGVVDTLLRDAVALAFAVRDVEINVWVQFLKVGINQRYGRRAVDVVVAIDHDAFLSPNGFVDAGDGLFHALHEEGVVNLIQSRSEKTSCLLKRGDAPLYEQSSDVFVNAQRCRKFLNSL